MKKIISIFIISILFIITSNVYASTDTFNLELKVINNKKNQKFDLYILLPKEYIQFAIQNDELQIEYDGANTLKNNIIPSIYVDKEKVLDDVYYQDGEEYVQILLEEKDGLYDFDILSDYDKMNFKYKISRNDSDDYIMHIDNFKINKNVCEIEYDYNNNSIKQPDKKVIPFATILLVIIAIMVLIIGFISYIKQRR